MSDAPNVQSANAQPLGTDELKRIDAWWRACNYLSVGMIYLRDNPCSRSRSGSSMSSTACSGTGGRARPSPSPGRI